jgi:hypothetical protein
MVDGIPRTVFEWNFARSPALSYAFTSCATDLDPMETVTARMEMDVSFIILTIFKTLP